MHKRDNLIEAVGPAVVRDMLTDAMMKIFQGLQRMKPELAAALRTDYEAVLQLIAEFPEAEGFNLEYARTRLPNNQWLTFMSEAAKGMAKMERPSKAVVRKEFRQRVAARAKKRDLN